MMKKIEQEFEEYKETLVVYDELIGKTFTKVKSSTIEKGHSSGNDSLEFLSDKSFRFYHQQDCCESVYIEDICGDLSDLVGSPITVAEEVTREFDEKCDEEYMPECATWTFYKFATVKGSVTVRWLGQSNGYYSESVDFEEIKLTLEKM